MEQRNIEGKIGDLAMSDDWLEHALAADGREHRTEYIADGGFTQRVMLRLPPPETLPAWRKPVVFLLWTAAAMGAVIALPDLTSEVARSAMRLLSGYPISLSGIATGLVALGAATWGAAAFVLRRNY